MNNTGMNWIRKEKRLAIYLRDGMACVYCGAAVEDEHTVLTLDHLRPRSKGGCNSETNLVTCCHRCNSNRQDRPVAEFIRAAAGYTNTDPKAIERHVRNCRNRAIKKAEAKDIMSRRSWAHIMQHGE